MNTTWFSFLKRIGKERKKKTKFCQASWFEGDLNHEGKANQMLFEISHWEENFAQLQSIIFFAIDIYFLMGIGGNLHEVIFCQIQQFVPIHCSSMRCWKKYRQKQLILSPINFFCIYGFLRIWSVFIPQKPDMIYVDVMGFFSGLLYVILLTSFQWVAD